MKIKTIAQVLLLGFVAMSLILAIKKMAPQSMDGLTPLTTTQADGSALTPVKLEAALGESRYSAVYFHAAHRCTTCRNIEQFSHQALLPEIEAGAIAWQVADYTSHANAAFVKQFEVFASTVVLVEVQDGKVVRWTNLEEVWNHTSNQSDFTRYINQAWFEFKTS